MNFGALWPGKKIGAKARPHHYAFAHIFLPNLVLYQTKLLVAFINEPSNSALKKLWAKAGETFAAGNYCSDRGLKWSTGTIGEHHFGALVQLPRPENVGEAFYFLGVYPRAWIHDPVAFQSTVPQSKGFVLTISHEPSREWGALRQYGKRGDLGSGPGGGPILISTVVDPSSGMTGWTAECSVPATVHGLVEAVKKHL